MTNTEFYRDVDVQEFTELDAQESPNLAHMLGWWMVTYPNGLIAWFGNEDEACLMQRMWREAHGIHMMNGTPLMTLEEFKAIAIPFEDEGCYIAIDEHHQVYVAGMFENGECDWDNFGPEETNDMAFILAAQTHWQARND